MHAQVFQKTIEFLYKLIGLGLVLSMERDSLGLILDPVSCDVCNDYTV